MRYLVDAMNVIGSRPDGWWNDPERAMRALAKTLDRYAASTGDRITVVFDKDPGELPELEHIEVAVARRKGRNAADHEIEDIVAGGDKPSAFTVVSSDRRLVEKVTALGARTLGAGTFSRRLTP